MKKFSLLLTLVMLVSLIGVASPAPVAADPLPGRIVQIPVIQVGDGWETWIQVQNVGVADTKFALLLFGYSGPYCGPQCKLPAKIEFSGRVPVGGAWTYKLDSVYTVNCSGVAFKPTSGILISLSMAQALVLENLGCTTAVSAVYTLWWNWWMKLTPVPAGEPAAVSVNRIQTGSGGTPRAAAYTGIADPGMETGWDPRTHAYMYYAPQLFDTFSPAGWSSKIWIQNSGIECTSLEIWFMKQQDCLKSRIQEVLALCPGETIGITPDMAGFLGSAWIRATQPLGVVVDEYNANGSIFMSYRGMPAEYWGGATMGHLFNFAPLIYREYNGWNTGIVVQNLSSVFNALVKVYFIDNSGDIIDTIVDWVCPRGSQTFYLPAINNLPGMYVGQARVESQNWWGPGDPPVDAPNVMSVVNLVNYNTGQGAAYNTFPKQEALLPKVKWVGLPFLAKDKHDPYEPSGTKWTSEIAMTNLDMIPGVSVWRIDFFDQNGLLYSLCQTLNEKQVDYIKLANIGIIPPGWLGSAIISWQCSNGNDQLGNSFGALGVVVVEKASGYASGDLTKAYEGFPLFGRPNIPWAVDCPECANLCPTGKIWGTITVTPAASALGARVELWRGTVLVDVTYASGNGYYEFNDVPASVAGIDYTIKASLTGYSTGTLTPVPIACGVTKGNANLELVRCKICTISGTAKVTPAGNLVGSTVELWKWDVATATWAKSTSTLTDSEGNFTFTGVACGKYHLKIIVNCEGQLMSFVSADFEWTIDCPTVHPWDFLLDAEECTGAWQ